MQSRIFSIFAFLSVFFSFGVMAAEPVSTAKPILRATAKQDCTCQSQSFDEDPEPFVVKKGQDVGEACEIHEKVITCDAGFPTRIHCPKDCLDVRSQRALTRDELKKAAIEAATASGVAEYSKRLPSKVFETLKKKYPNWLPAYYNRSGPYFAKYKLMDSFHFEFPISVQGKIQSVTAVYFFQDFHRLAKSEMNWSFWLSSNGDLLWDSVSPYPLYDGGYVKEPCPVPAGVNLDEVILYGIGVGVSDAAGCCGPYSLKQLKTKGPVKIEDPKKDIDQSEVIYGLCSQMVDHQSGKYKPEMLMEVNGPANIRKYSVGAEMDPGKAEIIGTCSDKAKLADLGTRGVWHSVYCEGKYGWTHEKNIRSLKK